MDVPTTIDCIDCGGRCHRIGYPPPEGDRPGDAVAYRCEDCLDRWDVIIDDDNDGPAEARYS